MRQAESGHYAMRFRAQIGRDMTERGALGQLEGARATPFASSAALAPGEVTPEGWLGRYAQLNADAWLLHYARNRDPEVYGKFWHRNQTSTVTFDEHNQTQILCDYTAYFADGMIHYAGLFPDSALAQEVDPWVEQVLRSQDADGYLGAFAPQARWQHWLEIFSQSLTLEALLHRYRCTGDVHILEACERSAALQMRTWYRPAPEVKPGIFSGHGTICVRALCQLYALTGKSPYRDCARDILSRYGRVQDFCKPGGAVANEHNAIGTEHVGLPAMVYEYVGDPALLEASRAAWEMMQHHLSVDGTPHGNEQMRQVGPRQNCEHCSTVEWFITSNALARITGEVCYADAAERAMLNAYPAAKSPDAMMVGYMHSPNQLVATEWSNPHFDSLDWWASRQHYHTAHEPLCCNANGPRGIPYYAESLVARCAGGLAVVYYAPCHVRALVPGAGLIRLNVKTDYPFEDRVTLTIVPDAATVFTLCLRIPGWCDGAAMAVNGEPLSVTARPGTYASLQRLWQPGDQVAICFEVPLRTIFWGSSEFGVRVPGVVLQRGPLTFALPVAEDWQPFTAPARGPGQEPRSCRLLPGRDAAWNYALVLDREHPESTVSLVNLPVPDKSQPWVYPPIGLRVPARRVLSWRMDGEPDHPMTPGLPYKPMSLADQEEIITLVPFGCTHLRLAYLPVAGRP
jgi:DUF1680 family protein